MVARPTPSGPAVGACRRGARALAGLALLAVLPGCETLNSLNPFASSGPAQGTPGFVRGFLGGVASDDPAAALAARNVLSSGGTAVDAAVAAGFTMAVTLPSRVGLGGGGACLVFDPAKAGVEAVLFPAGPRAAVPAGADRPAAVPLLARGLFALHTRLPRMQIEELIAPAEQAARFGTEVSRALANDLAAVAGPLFHDPNARAVFARPDGSPRIAGERILQPELAGTLGLLRVNGVGDLHQGVLARRLEEAAELAGGGALTVEELRAALPAVTQPLLLPTRGGDQIAFLPPPADGGLAAAAAFAALVSGQQPQPAAERGLAVAAAWRQGGGQPQALLASAQPPAVGMEILPASAGLMVFDRNGAAVTCAFSLNNLFGTGRIAPGLGFLLAAAPNTGSIRPALLTAAIGFNRNIRGFRLAAAGTGQQDAPMAVAGPAFLHLIRGAPQSDAVVAGVFGDGRVQFGACTNYLPGRVDRCAAISDPRGAGVALGTVD